MLLGGEVFQVGWNKLMLQSCTNNNDLICKSYNVLELDLYTTNPDVYFTSQTRSAALQSPVLGAELLQGPGVVVVQSLPAVPCLSRSHLVGASNPVSIHQATDPFCCGQIGRIEKRNW